MPAVAASMARVLKPGGRFLFFSYSAPDLLLPAVADSGGGGGSLSSPPAFGARSDRLWSDVDVRRLESLYLYVFRRVDEEDEGGEAGPPRHHWRGRKRKHQMRL